MTARLRRWSTTASAALALYCFVSFLYFGLRLLVEPGSQYVGYGGDPQIFIWSFAWWPHAILHGQNPFITHAIWAPTGVNLTWATSVPGLALLFSPLTVAFGAVFSYNAAAILIPALNAWTAYLLCRRLSRSHWASLAGGYLFGFSSYVLGQEASGHPHMTAVFLLPLIALTIVRYLDADFGRRGLVLRLTPLFAFQVLLSTELAFTVGIATIVALVLAGFIPEQHERVLSTFKPLALAAGAAVVVLAPFVYYALSGYQSNWINQPQGFIADLANYVVPTKLSLASLGWAAGIARRFSGNDGERDAYLGLPAIAIFVLYAWRRTPGAVVLVACTLAAVIASLGDHLDIAGRWHSSFPLPWSLVIDKPLFDNVLPSRLAIYVALAVAVAVALWAASRPPGALRVVLPALAVLALAPNVYSGSWTTTFSLPSFFTSGAYKACLRPGETILPLPAALPGDPMLWQVEAGFRFRMAGGYIAPKPPADFVSSNAELVIGNGYPVPPAHADLLRKYIADKGVTAVIVDEPDGGKWSRAMNTIATPEHLGGVILYRIAGARTC